LLTLSKRISRFDEDILMPRIDKVHITSAVDHLRKIAGQALVSLRSEIQTKEGDLRRIKEEVAQLVTVIGLRRAEKSTEHQGTTTSAKRIDWSAVLKKLPKQFKAVHIRKVRGVQDKQHSQIFKAIMRWVEAGSVKRKDRGLYERVR
jgi:hypothetical protein